MGCEALSFLWRCGLFGNDPKHVHVHGHSHDIESPSFGSVGYLEMIRSIFMCMDTAMILSQLLQMPMQKKTHSEGTDEVNTTYANNDN